MERNQGDGDYDSRHRQRHFGALVRRGVGFTDLFSPWQCSSGKAWHCSSGFSKTFHFADGTDTETEYEYDENGNINDINNHLYTYGVGTIYMDLINECEKLGDYVVNVVEARMGQRQKGA